MDYVLTLIGKNIARAAEQLAQQHGGDITWLDENNVCDIAPFPKLKLAKITGVDMALQPARARKKKLLVSDMDSTIILEETIDLLAALVGVEPEVAAITAQAMQGTLNFAQALTERVKLLKGVKVAEINGILNKITPRAGATTLTATMKKHGSHCLLLSGGFDVLVAPVAARTGFEAGKCNQLETSGGGGGGGGGTDGILTGALIPPIYDGASKKTLMLARAKELNLTPNDILAVGDGANDLLMVEAAGTGVCFGDKKILAEKADIQIEHNDLTALLYVQGYSKSEFV